MARFLLVAVLVAALPLGCGEPAPSADSTPDLATLPLPPGVSGIPEAGTPTAAVEPHTPAGTVPLGVPQQLQLGHCGLYSPLDFDGSLWDAAYGDDGSGGPLSEAQLGELINETTVELVLVDSETAQLVTPRGARILLVRHEGSRAYALCD